MDLSIIIVNYNGRDLLGRCLASIYSQPWRLKFETIVVDNGSTDGSEELLATEFPHVVAILNEDNTGFAAANNQGIFRSTGTHLLLLNSDTEIVGDALEQSLLFLRGKPDAGIVGCKLVFPNEKLQQSAYSFPGIWNLVCEMLNLHRFFPGSRFFGRYYLSYHDYESPAKVDWVSGAFFLLDRRVIERIGVLDEQFFMYSEEMDFCLRAARAGFETWYTPSAKIIHHWLTVEKVTVRGVAWVLQSQLLYFEKHFSGYRRFMMKTIRFSGVILRLLVYPIAGAIGMKKSLFHKWRCYCSALWLVATAGIHYEKGRPPVSWTRLT